MKTADPLAARKNFHTSIIDDMLAEAEERGYRRAINDALDALFAITERVRGGGDSGAVATSGGNAYRAVLALKKKEAEDDYPF